MGSSDSEAKSGRGLPHSTTLPRLITGREAGHTAFVAAARKAALIIPGPGPVRGRIGGGRRPWKSYFRGSALRKCVEVTAYSPAFLLGNRVRPRGISADSRQAATGFVAAARKAALIVPVLGPVRGQIGGVDGLGD